MIITRRSLFGFLAAPAIIRVADLMPIRVIAPPALVTPSRFTAEELAFINDAAIAHYADAAVYGTGFSQLLPDGTAEYIVPWRVWKGSERGSG